MQRADIWMVRSGLGACLALEPLPDLGIAIDPRGQHCDSDRAVQASVSSAIPPVPRSDRTS
jgi:hypothetical protein